MRITFAERTELFLFFLLVLLQDGYFLRVLQRHRVTQKYEVALPSSNYSLKKMDKYPGRQVWVKKMGETLGTGSWGSLRTPLVTASLRTPLARTSRLSTAGPVPSPEVARIGKGGGEATEGRVVAAAVLPPSHTQQDFHSGKNTATSPMTTSWRSSWEHRPRASGLAGWEIFFLDGERLCTTSDEEKLYEEKLYTLETDSAEKDTVDQELMKYKANRKAAKKDLAEIAKAAQTLGSFDCETLTSFSEQKTVEDYAPQFLQGGWRPTWSPAETDSSRACHLKKLSGTLGEGVSLRRGRAPKCVRARGIADRRRERQESDD